MNFPRTTDKVIDGLVAIWGHIADADMLQLFREKAPDYESEPAAVDSAYEWLKQLTVYRDTPRRKRPIPPQLKKVLKAKYVR